MSAAPPALELRAVHKSFGRTAIINGVDLAIAKGERHAIIGPNGAGKSTLFNLISGRFPLTSGQILLQGDDMTGREPQEIDIEAAGENRVALIADPSGAALFLYQLDEQASVDPIIAERAA